MRHPSIWPQGLWRSLSHLPKSFLCSWAESVACSTLISSNTHLNAKLACCEEACWFQPSLFQGHRCISPPLCCCSPLMWRGYHSSHFLSVGKQIPTWHWAAEAPQWWHKCCSSLDSPLLTCQRISSSGMMQAEEGKSGTSRGFKLKHERNTQESIILKVPLSGWHRQRGRGCKRA